MKRRSHSLLRPTILLIAAMLFTPIAEAGHLVRYSAARKHGLTRAWFSQVRLNAARHKVQDAVLHGDHLFVLTTAGSLQMLDANTGKTVWVEQVGDPRHPSLGPVVSSTHVAVANGAKVYVLDRASGRGLLVRRTTDGIASAPALSKNYVFVPQFSGRVDAFGLENPRPIPWYFTSAGRIFEDAVASKSSIVWATDRGHLYVADPNAGGVRFRFESALPFDAPPTMQSGMIFAASMGGYVYGISEETGRQVWRYACGFPVTESPIALGKTLYVVSVEPAIHCLDADSGKVKWAATGVAQFISASEQRIYGLDELGNLVILDRNTGVVRSRASTVGDHQAVLNEQTDRLYIVSSDGLVQCLHELGLKEPILHSPKATETKGNPKDGDGESKPEEKPGKPQAAPADPFGADGDPFGAGGDTPADDPFGGSGGGSEPSEDPFGGGAGGSEPSDDPFGGGEEPSDAPDDNPFG